MQLGEQRRRFQGYARAAEHVLSGAADLRLRLQQIEVDDSEETVDHSTAGGGENGLVDAGKRSAKTTVTGLKGIDLMKMFITCPSMASFTVVSTMKDN